MEFATKETLKAEAAERNVEAIEMVRELNELQLALVGGGMGDTIL